MNLNRRPISVLILASLYIALGAVGFVYHFRELAAFERDSVWVELMELLAIVSGAFMMMGHNWARWLALSWMAFHVAISFPVRRFFIIHLLLFLVIAWILSRPAARRYFAHREH